MTEERRYGQWAGSPKGSAEDETRCVEDVFGDWYSHQCMKKRGHGKDKLYCKQHAKKHLE